MGARPSKRSVNITKPSEPEGEVVATEKLGKIDDNIAVIDPPSPKHNGDTKHIEELSAAADDTAKTPLTEDEKRITAESPVEGKTVEPVTATVASETNVVAEPETKPEESKPAEVKIPAPELIAEKKEEVAEPVKVLEIAPVLSEEKIEDKPAVEETKVVTEEPAAKTPEVVEVSAPVPEQKEEPKEVDPSTVGSVSIDVTKKFEIASPLPDQLDDKITSSSVESEVTESVAQSLLREKIDTVPTTIEDIAAKCETSASEQPKLIPSDIPLPPVDVKESVTPPSTPVDLQSHTSLPDPIDDKLADSLENVDTEAEIKGDIFLPPPPVEERLTDSLEKIDIVAFEPAAELPPSEELSDSLEKIVSTSVVVEETSLEVEPSPVTEIISEPLIVEKIESPPTTEVVDTLKTSLSEDTVAVVSDIPQVLEVGGGEKLADISATESLQNAAETIVAAVSEAVAPPPQSAEVDSVLTQDIPTIEIPSQDTSLAVSNQ